jgi:hypothetical protein
MKAAGILDSNETRGHGRISVTSFAEMLVFPSSHFSVEILVPTLASQGWGTRDPSVL